MSNDSTDRIEGVDFTEINPVLDDLSYPITSEELLEQYGESEVERTNAEPISLEELFQYMGEDVFDSKRQLRQMILGQMPRGSEGRTNYSDRGGSHPVETKEAEEASRQTSADLEPGEATDRDQTQR